MEHQVVHMVVIVACAGVFAQWIAWRFRFPAIVVLTMLGLILGPVSNVVDPEAIFGDLLRPFVQLAVAVILFEGGLNLHWHELKDSGKGVRRLISAGLILSFIFGSLAARYVGGLSWPVATVFGAIIVVTGPTVIMPLLRQARLRPRTASILKWEGIVNDPLGALLAVVLFEYWVSSGPNTHGIGFGFELVAALFAAAATGAAVGYGLGKAYPRGIVPEYLKGPMMLAAVFLVYAIGNMLHEEAGLVSTTVLGLVMGNMRLPSIDELRRFKEYITVVLVSGLFIVLTANLKPDLLAEIDTRSWMLLFLVIFVIRPVVIFLATIGADMDIKDRILVGWIAPRGIVAAAVAGAFSIKMIDAGYSDAVKLLPLIFALILLTVTLHGFSIGFVARRLGIASEHQNGMVIVGASPWSIELAKKLNEMDVPVLLVDSSWHRLRPARLAGLPIYFGQLVSESADETFDVSSMGYIFAATDNDAYNALVCTRFANEFERQRVFQLPMPSQAQHETKGFTPALRGRLAFQDEAVDEEILRRYFQGWRFQKTKITEEYTFENYLADVEEQNFARLIIKANGDLKLNHEIVPDAGDTVINFLPAKPAEKA
ncbi:MAG: cation:proton antiporter [Pseudomonadota bacterium]